MRHLQKIFGFSLTPYRINKHDYILKLYKYGLIAALASLTLGFFSGLNSIVGSFHGTGFVQSKESLSIIITALIILIATIWLINCTIVQMKRLHDLNLSSWYVILTFVPYINIFCNFAFILIDGSAGMNKYGNKPEDTIKFKKILANILGIIAILANAYLLFFGQNYF